LAGAALLHPPERGALCLSPLLLFFVFIFVFFVSFAFFVFPRIMASRLISCRRLSGGLLQTSVDAEVSTIREVKEAFAQADPVRPPVPWVALLGEHVRGQAGGLVELPDSEDIENPWVQLELSSTGMLTYVVRSPDLMAMIVNLEVESDLCRLCPPPLMSPPPPPPGRGGWHIREILLYKDLLRMMKSVSWDNLLYSEAAAEFWETLRFGLLNLPAEEANKIEHDGMTILIGLARLYCELDIEIPNSLLDFLSREDLSIEMIKSVVVTEIAFPSPLDARMVASHHQAMFGAASGAKVSALSLTLSFSLAFHAYDSTGRMLRIAHRIVEVLAEQAPEVSGVSDRGDTTLMNILTLSHFYLCWMGPVRHEKVEAWARLCLSLVAQMNLPQLCHRNLEGLCALSLAERRWFEKIVDDKDKWRAELQQVRLALKQRIILLASQIISLPDLLQQVDVLDRALRDLWCADLEEVVSAVKGAARSLAAQVRREWLDRGWRFQTRAMHDQVEEVIQHFQP